VPQCTAIPSPTSRLYPVAAKALDRMLGEPTAPHGRVLTEAQSNGWRLMYCRGTDVGALVVLGVADIGLTGYDMVAETIASGRSAPTIWSLAPTRTSYVCLLKPEQRTHVTRIYTEYPHLTHAWLSHSRMFTGACPAPAMPWAGNPVAARIASVLAGLSAPPRPRASTVMTGNVC
jgi:ATP phosphoribosyltransferase